VQCVIFLAALCGLNLESLRVSEQTAQGEYSTHWEKYYILSNYKMK